jgi:beta-ureidopropionase / N-carbamoyl-L-amino-acid hydrolase
MSGGIQPEAVAEAVAAERALAESLFDALRYDGLNEPGVTRDPYGPGEQRAHRTAAAAAERLGLRVEQDFAANTYMTLPGRDPHAPRVVVGSHLDSVPHGGNFDGAAGVVAGLVAVAALKRLGVATDCDLTVMAVRAEESVWFQVSYVGSRSALGSLPEGALDARRIDTGRTLADHIAECGGDPEAIRARRRFLEPAKLRAFLELHIEQAPSLVESGKPLAICTGIPGNFRYADARIEGRNEHVGLPRRFRRDAALAGADFATALDRAWEEHEARGVPMAATLGRFHTDAALHAMTVVPGRFHFSLDVRAYDEAVLAGLDRRVDAIVAEIEGRRGVRFHLGRKARATVGPVAPAIKASLEAGARALGLPFAELGSPASHDAAAFAEAGVPTAMLFVRNQNGSHNPEEAMEIDDFLHATSVLTLWLVANVARQPAAT